jgi:hypothetical protein
VGHGGLHRPAAAPQPIMSRPSQGSRLYSARGTCSPISSARGTSEWLVSLLLFFRMWGPAKVPFFFIIFLEALVPKADATRSRSKTAEPLSCRRSLNSQWPRSTLLFSRHLSSAQSLIIPFRKAPLSVSSKAIDPTLDALFSTSVSGSRSQRLCNAARLTLVFPSPSLDL